MRKIFTLLTVLVASVCGLTPAKADKATLDEGYYYIINTYEKFASMKAWFYGQVDARQADQYAFLCWDDFSANDPRFIFEVKKGTAENGYVLKSMASEFFLSGLSSDSLVAANPDAGTNYYFEEVGSTDDGKTYYIWNDSLVWTRGERSADNRIYPDSHQYGAGNKGHLGGNRWWTLEDNGAAKWLLVKLSDEDLASFSKTKLLLANLVSSINNPNVFGANGADADAYNALKAAWNAADEALKGMETDATYERLYTELNQAKINADDSHVTLKEGIYYIVSTYEKFGDRQAWNYSQAYQNSTKYAGADLYWSSLSTGDLRFMFEIKMMGDGLGYTIMNYASGKYVGGKASGSTMIAMEQEPTVPQYFEETGDGTFYVYNDETGGNMFYCDSHGFGGGRNGNIGCNNWWTLDENAAAKWELVKVTDEELAKISEAKLKLARKVCEIRDPNTSGAGDYDLEKFQALKDAWNAANESLETIESDATYEMLYDDLQAALDAADGSVTEFEPGWYYIESAYEDFAETVAMCQDRIDNTGAELVYEPLVEGDPKFIFYIDRVDAGKVTIQNVASGLYLTQAGEMGWTQHFVRMGEDAAIQMMELGEEGTCQLYLSSYGSNRYFPDSHAFGANTVGHISISNAWGEVPDAALWKLVPVEDDNLYLISDAKLNLYQYLLTEYNPFVMGEDPGYVSADVYDAFNGAYTWAISAAQDPEADEETCDEFLAQLQEQRELADQELIPLRDGGLYYIISQYYNYTSTERYKAMCYAEDEENPARTLYWAELEEDNPSFIWKFTPKDETSWNVQNYDTKKYISSPTSNLLGTCVESDSIGQYFYNVGFGEFRIGPASSYPSYAGRLYYQDNTGYGSNESQHVGCNSYSLPCNNTWAVRTYGFELTIPASGIASLLLPFTAVVPSGVSLYGITKQTGTEAGYTQFTGDVLAARTPVIVKGEPGTYVFLATADEGQTVDGNLLQGSAIHQADLGSSSVYVVGNSADQLSLNTDEVLPVGTVYLKRTGNSRALVLKDANDVDGISQVTVENKASAGVVYDLQGRQVQKPAKGIYLVGKKKVALK